MPLLGILGRALSCRSDCDDDKTIKGIQPAPLSKVFRSASYSEVIYVVIALLTAIIGGAIQPFVLVIGGWIADLYLRKESAQDNDEFLTEAIQYSGYGVLLGVVVLVLALIQGVLIQRATVRITNGMKRDFLKAVLHQNAEWQAEHTSGSINFQLNENIEIISDGLGNKTCLLLRGFSMFISSIVACCRIDWRLTAVTLTMGPLSAMVLGFLGKVVGRYTVKLLELSADAQAVFEESVLHVRTVQAFNGQQFMKKKLSQILQKTTKLYQIQSFWAGFFDGMAMCVVYCITGIALFYGIEEYFAGMIKEAGDVILIVNTICVSGYFLGLLGPHIMDLTNARIAVSNIYQTIDSNPEKLEKPLNELSNTKGHIIFKNVHFSYPSRNTPVLQGLSFEAKPGETIALVGTSGSGKSTSVGLLTKLFKPTRGEILLDGQNVQRIDDICLRQKIGIVQQEPRLFEGTILDNIQLGREINLRQLTGATKTANAYKFIMEFEMGYSTLLGTGGVQLSGGQKQRICIARALVNSPPILILDEATSALDTYNEQIVQTALNNASKGRTTIMIAHRFSTLKHVSRIYLIDKGVAAEVGTHDELMAKGGLYARLARSQEIEQSAMKDWEREEAVRAEKIKKKKLRGLDSIDNTNVILRPGRDTKLISIETHDSDAKPQKKGFSYTGLKKILAWVPKHKKRLCLIVLASIPRSAEMPAFGLGLSCAFCALQQENGQQYGYAFKTLVELIAAGFIMWFTQALLMFLCGWVASDVMKDVKERVLSDLLHKPMSFFDKPDTSPSACVSNVSIHAPNCYGCLDHRSIRIVWFTLGTIISLSMAFPFVWELGILGFITTFLLTVVLFMLLNAAQSAQYEKSSADRSAQYALEMVEQAQTIRLLAVENYFQTRFEREQKESELYENTIGNISSLNFAITQSYVFFCDMLFFYVGSLMLYNGMYSPELIFLAFNGAQMSAWGVMYVSPYFPEVVKSTQSANELFSLLDDKSHEPLKPNPKVLKPSIEGTVNIEDVIFSFPNNPKHVVCNELNLSARKGECIALVGASGSGKSTVIQLLERYYTQQSGEITIDGLPISDFDIHHLREIISVVGQEPVLFKGSIFDNVTLGVGKATMNDVVQACLVANAHGFISSFPEGYETCVGEKGGSLSGGQRQRIAIARAIIRKPKVLLLDEATSALDAQCEMQTQLALKSACAGRTCIIIAHRLNTIQHCDRIFYISRGSVAESGTHLELLEQNHKYAKLVQAQSLA